MELSSNLYFFTYLKKQCSIGEANLLAHVLALKYLNYYVWNNSRKYFGHICEENHLNDQLTDYALSYYFIYAQSAQRQSFLLKSALSLISRSCLNAMKKPMWRLTS